MVIGLLCGSGLGFAAGFLIADDTSEAAVVADEPVVEDAEVALPRELPRLQEFVAAERELEFLEDVEIRFLDDDAFEEALATESESGMPQMGESAEYAQTYAALRLARDAEEYLELESEGFTGGVGGYFDTESEELVIRGTTWNPLVESTLVHELTHALQDQHFDLDALTEATRLDDESYLALTAVIEGDASRVEYAFSAEQDEDWQEGYSDALFEVETGGFGGWDPLAEAWGRFPYSEGALAVDELFAIGGNAAVDDALSSPPRSTENIVSIREWSDADLETEPGQSVPGPTALDGARIVDRGTLGAFGIGILPLANDNEFYAYATDYIDGWAGDRYTTWLQDDGAGERPCTKVSVVFDRAGDADEAVEYLEEWVELDDTEATRVGETGLELASCGRPV